MILESWRFLEWLRYVAALTDPFGIVSLRFIGSYVGGLHIPEVCAHPEKCRLDAEQREVRISLDRHPCR